MWGRPYRGMFAIIFANRLCVSPMKGFPYLATESFRRSSDSGARVASASGPKPAGGDFRPQNSGLPSSKKPENSASDRLARLAPRCYQVQKGKKKWGALHVTSSNRRDRYGAAGSACLRAKRGASGPPGAAEVTDPDRAGEGERKRLQAVVGEYPRSAARRSMGWCARRRARKTRGKRRPRQTHQGQQHGKLEPYRF